MENIESILEEKITGSLKSREEKSPEDDSKKEEGRSEKSIKTMDDAFNELISKAKDSPEAERLAVEIFIANMKQTAEQIRQVTDLKNIQELKVKMLENWEELKRLTGGDPELLKSIQAWGSDFVQSKVLYNELMDGVKEKLNDGATSVSETWTDMQLNLGQMVADLQSDIEDPHKRLDRYEIEELLYDRGGLLEGDRVLSKNNGLTHFLESISKVKSGYEAGDLDVHSVEQFFTNINKVVFILSKTQNPEKVRELQAFVKELRSKVADTIKMYIATQTLRDTHFLDVFNKGPEEDQS